MIEYLPWSIKEQAICLNAYKTGIFTILDIELGGKCNYNCLYCDSPNRRKKCNLSIDGLERLMLQGQFRWVYICGLGEPSFKGENYNHLISILKLCEKYNLRCSIFTNLSNLTVELKEFIKRGILFLLFKFDTLKPSVVKTLYGTKQPGGQLEAINEIAQLVHCEEETTNIAASIVPTQFNYSEIPQLIHFCHKYNIFPLLGELESSGRGKDNYSNLFLSDDELKEIKEITETILGHEYSIPMCPAVISGVHIDNENRITVDAKTGLSCHWFWLEKPKTKTIGFVDSNCSVENIRNQILQYREKTLSDVKKHVLSESSIGGAFGGCGGDVINLFNTYLSACHSEQPHLSMNQVHSLVNTAYNNIADKYAAAYSDNDETDFHFFRFFVDNMKGKIVLDMGCGVGANTDMLTKSGISVIGIDASAEMLRNAHRMYPDLSFEEQNILSTSFPDKSFDGIVLSYVIEHFNNDGLQQLHNEIDRLLVDGGLLFISSHEGNGEALLADPLDESISIYYNFLSSEMLDSLFSNYEKVDYAKRASYGPDEFLNDKMFVTYRKSNKDLK